MKIIKVNASFSMKKSLGNYEMADIFFAAEAEVMDKDDPEKVAQQVHDFCKKLAVEKYNSFSKQELVLQPLKPTPEEEYQAHSVASIPMKVYKADPKEIQRIIDNKPKYRATDKNGGKEKIIKEDLTPQ